MQYNETAPRSATEQPQLALWKTPAQQPNPTVPAREAFSPPPITSRRDSASSNFFTEQDVRTCPAIFPVLNEDNDDCDSLPGILLLRQRPGACVR